MMINTEFNAGQVSALRTDTFGGPVRRIVVESGTKTTEQFEAWYCPSRDSWGRVWNLRTFREAKAGSERETSILRAAQKHVAATADAGAGADDKAVA